MEITLNEDSRGRLSSFMATGHAGWAESGTDIVCGAVSTLLQSAWLGLAEVAGIAVDGRKERGALQLAWPEEVREDAAVRAIVETAARSIERIARQYPENVRAIRVRNDG